MKIFRKYWFVGDSCVSKLLGPIIAQDTGGLRNKRCCLGFLAQHLGADDDAIWSKTAPSVAMSACNWPNKLFDDSDNYLNEGAFKCMPTDWEGVFVRINDASGIDNETREEWIATGFKMLFDIDVEFVGEY